MDKDKFLTWCVTKLNLSKNSLHHTSCRFDYIFRWLGNRPLNSGSSSELILSLRQRGLRNSSINAYISALSHIDQYLLAQGEQRELLSELNYFPKQPVVPTILFYEEIEKILSVDIKYSQRNGASEEETEKINTTYKTMIHTLADTGARYEEVASLKKANLFLSVENGYVEFKETKNHSNRLVDIPPLLVIRLIDFTQGLKPSDLVFTTTKGHKVPLTNFNPDLRKRAEMAKVNKHIHAHVFRHSFIDEHRRRGTPDTIIARLVGHNDLNSTTRYGGFARELLRSGAENHPSFSKSVDPKKILLKGKATIENLLAFQDSRFERTMRTDEFSVDVHIEIKPNYRV